ncbi:motile sperm domain-containing protein 2 [Drosophila subpulchrella]|uniref:motile sperm domain-containing protein 2 n=1 Tax=Drosophila subpulchrella TaxID=1486046 RepID=UPI0018A1802A|nr:motile sperm domain-containing protein 2 [Drosophila subpulchrella]
MPSDQEPTAEQISQVKDSVLEKLDKELPAVHFHPADLKRITGSDLWISKLLQAYDFDVEKCIIRLLDNLAWRLSFGVYDLSETNLNQEYLNDGSVYVHNKDKDGKPLLILSINKHSKSRKQEDLLRIIVFWIERLQSVGKVEQVTLFMDMTGSGLSNLDLDFIKSIIGVFETKYPYILNYILVHELPFLLNAAFKIVKTFLPEKALKILKVTSKKDIDQYVDKDNCLKIWGGNDEYVYKFA